MSESPASEFILRVAELVHQHLHDESGDGDAVITLSDNKSAADLRRVLLERCSWLKDCTQQPGISLTAPEGAVTYLLSDMCNENVHITTDSNLERTAPSWVGLRLRVGSGA
ncbi:MAG: hypothetical protein EBZ49_11640 [Proteobacteria bacterium]|nr:hypothetical protein [Pseudomonadota bacterium]